MKESSEYTPKKINDQVTSTCPIIYTNNLHSLILGLTDL